MEVKIWEIVFPLPADAPEISVWVAVQLNVAPTGVLDKTILVIVPEQIVLGVGGVNGSQFTFNIGLSFSIGDYDDHADFN